MDSIFSFYSKLRAQGVSEADALQQAVYAARSDGGLPFMKPDEVEKANAQKKQVDAVSFIRNLAETGRQHDVKEFEALSGDLLFSKDAPAPKSKVELHECLTSLGINDQSP